MSDVVTAIAAAHSLTMLQWAGRQLWLAPDLSTAHGVSQASVQRTAVDQHQDARGQALGLLAWDAMVSLK